MSQKQIVGEAKRKIRPVSVTVYQRRPWTIAIMVGSVDNVEYTGIGVTKVCWPDWWSAKKGADIAKGKAIKHIAKQSLGLDVPWLVQGFDEAAPLLTLQPPWKKGPEVGAV